MSSISMMSHYVDHLVVVYDTESEFLKILLFFRFNYQVIH